MLKNYVIVDLETTGLRPNYDKIIEIGAIKVTQKEGVQQTEVYNRLIHPGISIPKMITEIVGITDDMVKDAPKEESIIAEFLDFVEDLPLIGHNLRFDYSFLKTVAVRYGYSFERDGLDTLTISKKYLSELESRKLDDLCRYFGIMDENHHRAWNDAKVTGELYQILCDKFEGLEDAEKYFAPHPMQYTVKKESPATAKQISFLQALIARHGLDISVQPDILTKAQASRMIDKIILQYGK